MSLQEDLNVLRLCGKLILLVSCELNTLCCPSAPSMLSVVAALLALHFLFACKMEFSHSWESRNTTTGSDEQL